MRWTSSEGFSKEAPSTQRRQLRCAEYSQQWPGGTPHVSAIEAQNTMPVKLMRSRRYGFRHNLLFEVVIIYAKKRATRFPRNLEGLK